jgi:ABC-type glycerol-3-phosphate transport system permease component
MAIRENETPREIFSGKAPYLWALVGCIFCVAPMLRAGMRHDWFLHTQNASPSFIDIIGSLFCVAFMVSVMQKTTSFLERSILIGIIAVCFLWFLRILAAYGVSWLQFPESFAISTFIAVAATVLVGARAVQVMSRKHM